MKINQFLSGVLCLGLCVVPLAADDGGAVSPRESLFRAESLELWTVGVAGEKQERGIEAGNLGVEVLESMRLYGTLSCDVLSWLAICVGAGQTELEEDSASGHENGEFMWMSGLRMNIFEHEVFDPYFLACLCRVQATASYWAYESELSGETVDWQEWRYATAFQVEFFVDDSRNDRGVCPYSTVFSVGPVYSDIDGDFEEDKALGVLLGLDLKLAGNLSVGWESRLFDDATHGVNVAFHF